MKIMTGLKERGSQDINPLGVSPSKGNQGTTRGKEKIF